MENVLIQTLPEEIQLNFTIGALNTRFSSKYIVKFFDWDRSYYETIGNNDIIADHMNMRTVPKFVRRT